MHKSNCARLVCSGTRTHVSRARCGASAQCCEREKFAMATAHHPGTRGRVGPETISYQRRRMQPKHALASRNTRYDLSYYGRTTTKERTRCRHIENMCVPSV